LKDENATIRQKAEEYSQISNILKTKQKESKNGY